MTLELGRRKDALGGEVTSQGDTSSLEKVASFKPCHSWILSLESSSNSPKTSEEVTFQPGYPISTKMNIKSLLFDWAASSWGNPGWNMPPVLCYLHCFVRTAAEASHLVPESSFRRQTQLRLFLPVNISWEAHLFKIMTSRGTQEGQRRKHFCDDSCILLLEQGSTPSRLVGAARWTPKFTATVQTLWVIGEFDIAEVPQMKLHFRWTYYRNLQNNHNKPSIGWLFQVFPI